jgi:choline-sulfatase
MGRPLTRPNILLIVADQLAARFLPAYGHRSIRAPSLDRLAQNGVVFERAYTNSPLCAPARATLMSGCLPSRTGVYDNAAEFRSAYPAFTHYLRLGGYRTCLIGKMHFVGPDQLHGFEERLTTDIYPADFGWTPDWTRPGERIDWWYHNMSSVKQAGTAAITNQLDYDDEVAFLANRRIHDFARQRQALPFCLTVSFTHPHDPYVAREPFWQLYQAEDIDDPAVPAQPYEALDPHSRRLFDACAIEEVAIGPDDIRRARHGYYANVSYVDKLIGELLASLRACDLYDDTIVVVTSDHGDFLGEYGLWYKMSFRDPSARVPLIVHAPARYAPRRVKACVSLADLLPTFVDFAEPGASAALVHPVDGRSLVDALAGGSPDPRPVIGEYLAEGVAAPMYMVVDDRWKYICCGDDAPQLFALDSDQNERVNRAESEPGQVAHFDRILAESFDIPRIRADVLASQKARLALFRALSKGKIFPWDYQPLQAASEQYTRNHRDVSETDAASRYPPAPPFP